MLKILKKRHFIILSTAALTASAIESAHWFEQREAIKAMPGLMRYHLFDSAEREIANSAPFGTPLVWSGSAESEVETTAGRFPETRAVLLDETSYRASVTHEIKNEFTVSIWVKPEGSGQHRIEGRDCGMICSSGSGYYDGWRLTVSDIADMTTTFEIGIGKKSIGLRANIPLTRSCWNHLVATWDGGWMRIFINGMPAGMREFADHFQPPKSDFAVGYNNYGVGSLRMGVSELALFNRALSAAEITALSLAATSLPSTAAVIVNAAQAHLSRNELEKATLELNKIISGDFAVPLKLWAEYALLMRRNNVLALSELALHPALSSHLQSAAYVQILDACKNKSEQLNVAILEKLPTVLTLSEEDKFVCARALANSYFAEKQAAQGFLVLDHLLTVSSNDCTRLRDLHFDYASLLRADGENERAASHYLAVANSVEQPGYARSIAALALARSFKAQVKYEQAIAACNTICSSEIALPHHIYEAREMIKECENLQQGKPARDAEQHRRRPAPLPQPGVLFFVAPNGSDINPGTLKKPFGTLTKARDAIRAIKKRNQGRLPDGGVRVYLRGGVYHFKRPLKLEESDSGRYGAPVVYMAWQNEVPVFEGGFKARRFRRVRDAATLARLPAEARGKVYVTDLKRLGFSDFAEQRGYGFGIANESVRAVYVDGECMPLARWPNDSQLTVGELQADQRTFTVDAERLTRWSAADNLMADGFWYHLWAGETLHIASVNAAKGLITLADKPVRGIQSGRPFFVKNLLEEIDQPGEWFFDRSSGKLYIWLERHPWFCDVVISERKEMFIEAAQVRDLVVKGIHFRYGQQHAAQFSECVNLAVIGCRFHGFGGTALIINDVANAMIYGNKLDTLGHGGMRVSGGNRQNLVSGGVHIENNEVAHFGLASKTYVPAVHLGGVGAVVAHNWFHHAPSSALRIEGNDHIVEYNLTEFVVSESDDQGGIDMWGNASYRGCVMRYNIWRDIGAGDAPCGQAGIRFDDAISGMVVYGNVFERSSNGRFGGVQIHGGHLNIIDNNLFIDCRYALSFSPWSLERFNEFVMEKNERQLFKEVNVKLPPYSTKYPELTKLQDKSAHNVNYLWRNVVIGAEKLWRNAPQQSELCDNHQAADYKPDALILNHTTFAPLPLNEIGIYSDSACAW